LSTDFFLAGKYLDKSYKHFYPHPIVGIDFLYNYWIDNERKRETARHKSHLHIDQEVNQLMLVFRTQPLKIILSSTSSKDIEIKSLLAGALYVVSKTPSSRMIVATVSHP
jgi:hypothetical protein